MEVIFSFRKWYSNGAEFVATIEPLARIKIFGRNLFWYGAVFGGITAIGRALVSDEVLVLDPHGTMTFVVQQTHYMPKRWCGKENTEVVRVEFETLFQYTGKAAGGDASIFLTSFLLIFVVPEIISGGNVGSICAIPRMVLSPSPITIGYDSGLHLHKI